MEMNNTCVVIKKMVDKFYVSVSTSFPTAYVIASALEDTVSEALQSAFSNFAQELNDRKIWDGEPLPKKYDTEDVVLYDSSCLDFVEYKNTQDNKITCTTKIGNCVAVATATSYQYATCSSCLKIANYFINKL